MKISLKGTREKERGGHLTMIEMKSLRDSKLKYDTTRTCTFVPH